MFKEIDCRGLECPKPVILTKQALEEATEGVVVTIVDNPIARDNVLRLAESMKLQTEVHEDNGEFQISINKNADDALAAVDVKLCASAAAEGDYVILVRSNLLGSGNDDLGEVLMRSFFFTVASDERAPKRILFLNGGVKLTCEGSEVLESLQALIDKGVEVISCGTCLDFYQLKDRLQVGRIGNMYDIFDSLASYRVISV